MISVVIPTWNEAPRLPALLAALRAEPTPHEIIVSDGGSPDGSATVARAAGADRVIVGATGRGAQLREGAALARGETLLLLHADTQFPPGGLVALAAALAAAPRAVGGNFRLVFEGEERFARRLTRFYATIRALGLFYGDSGIFVRRAAYAAIGGIRPLAIMEDYDLVRRMRRAGPTLRIDDPPLTTSVRRFAGRPTADIVAGWLRAHALHSFGYCAERSAALYDARRERGG